VSAAGRRWPLPLGVRAAVSLAAMACRAGGLGVRLVCGRPVRATLISSSSAPSSATGGSAANNCALVRSGAWATLRASDTAVAQATRVQAYQGSRQASPRR
jgi:hypothetical protein